MGVGEKKVFLSITVFEQISIESTTKIAIIKQYRHLDDQLSQNCNCCQRDDRQK